jgi:uncharacterized protein YecE (DUF72 family)
LVTAERKDLGLLNLHVGTIGWSYNFWKGPFYPKKQPSNKLLDFYASKFNSVEVDGTFYRIPTMQTVINWKQQTPDDFMFSLKFPQLITHLKMLKNCKNETDFFLDRVKLLDEKLGPLLLQFPPNFGIERLPDLADFLGKLPMENRYAVEVRNKNLLNEGLYSVLRDNNVALAWADSAVMLQIDQVTSDFLYIRWEGDRAKVKGILGKIEVERGNDIEAWAKRIKPYVDKQISVFGYFGKYYSGYPPLDVKLFLDIITR